jgi:hypothetical protein
MVVRQKRNGCDPDLRSQAVPLDFGYFRLILEMSAPDARPMIRRLSVDETRSRNPQMVASIAILRDEL